MKEMFRGVVNSPNTTITNTLGVSDTQIYVLDDSVVPETLPNLMVLGSGMFSETVKVIALAGGRLTVERGFQGYPKNWPEGTIIARNFTEYDYEALRYNVEALKDGQDGIDGRVETIEGRYIWFGTVETIED